MLRSQWRPARWKGRARSAPGWVVVFVFITLFFCCLTADSKAVLVGFDPRTATATAWESVWKIAWSAAGRAKLRFGGGTPRVGGRAHRATEWWGLGRAQTEFGHERAKMNPAPTERNKGGRSSCPVGAFHLPDHSTQGGARAPSTSSGPFGSLALGWLASGRWPDFWRDFQSNPASHPPQISPRFSPRTYRRS
jgi:hypothetical protein